MEVETTEVMQYEVIYIHTMCEVDIQALIRQAIMPFYDEG